MSSEIKREYVRADDMVVAYVDHTNVLGTGTELILSLYDTIPPFPGEDSEQIALSRLRACIKMHPHHALQVGEMMTNTANKMIKLLNDGGDDESEADDS